MSLTIVAVFLCVAVGFLFMPRTPGLAAVARQGSATPTPPPDATLVGANCKSCHAAVVNSFQSEIHGKSAKFSEGDTAASCDSCHGNTAKHADISTAGSPVRPVAGTQAVFGAKGELIRINASEINQSCLKCHSQDKTHQNWAGGQHEGGNMSCITCHSVHHSRSQEGMLSAATVEDTCLSCHSTVRKAVFQRSSHLIRSEQGNMKVGCTSCHNPHGGEGDKMLKADTINDTCYECHAEKRGPFLWEHPPVRENCMTCHSPHGSNNAKLLTARANLSCQQCHIHMLPRHSTTAGQALDIWSLNRGCVNCHNQIHGSNHPGGRTFTR